MNYHTSLRAFFTERKGKARLLGLKTEVDGYTENADLSELNENLRKRNGADAVYYILDCISREYSRALKKIRNKKEKKIKSRFPY